MGKKWCVEKKEAKTGNVVNFIIHLKCQEKQTSAQGQWLGGAGKPAVFRPSSAGTAFTNHSVPFKYWNNLFPELNKQTSGLACSVCSKQSGGQTQRHVFGLGREGEDRVSFTWCQKRKTKRSSPESLYIGEAPSGVKACCPQAWKRTKRHGILQPRGPQKQWLSSEWERGLSKRAKCSRHPRTVRAPRPPCSC